MGYTILGLKLQRSEGPEHGKAVMCRTEDYKYVRRLYESDELYDLRADPQEIHNCAGEMAYTEVLAKMKDRLLRFLLETADAVPWQADSRR